MPIRTAWAHRARWVLWTSLVLSWLVMLPVVWAAFSTLPSPERLARSRMIEIPTLGSVALIVLVSAIELAAVLALLFPGLTRRFLARLWIAAVGVWIWFFASTPLDLAKVEWVHRRWLALVGAALLLGAGIATVARILGPKKGEPDDGVERPAAPE